MATPGSADSTVMAHRLQGGSWSKRRRRIAAISTAGALMALVAIVEAMILIFHGHTCPPGWTQFDFDAPVGTASLVVTVPLLLVTLSSSVSPGVGAGLVRRAVRRVAFTSLAVAIPLTMVTMAIVLFLGWGTISNLGSSTSGCLTF